jgi:hypothetical protein
MQHTEWLSELFPIQKIPTSILAKTICSTNYNDIVPNYILISARSILGI